MRALLPIVALFCGVAVPDAPERPHPIVLRRERLGRQRQHAHGRGRR